MTDESVKMICKGPRVPGAPAMNDLRVYCGEDITKLVQAVPADGKEQKVTCPKCGNVITVKRMP